MELVARAPTRLDFGGGWTDVPPYSDEQGGFVCSVALGLHAVATVRDGAGAGDAAADDGARDLAITRAAIRRAGLTNVRVDIESRFPVGAGLGGSSAAGVAALGALAAFQGRPIDPAALAESSRQMEVEDLGIAGGRQDHYAAAVGGALGLRFGGERLDRKLDGLDRALRVRALPVLDDLVGIGQEEAVGEQHLEPVHAEDRAQGFLELPWGHAVVGQTLPVDVGRAEDGQDLLSHLGVGDDVLDHQYADAFARAHVGSMATMAAMAVYSGTRLVRTQYRPIFATTSRKAAKSTGLTM